MSRPGQSARKIADSHYFSRAFGALVLLGVCLVAMQLIPALVGMDKSSRSRGKEPHGIATDCITGLIGIGGLLMLVQLISRVVIGFAEAHREMEQKAVRGAKAEDKVGKLLETLPANCKVFHDVDTGRGDIDHIILSSDKGVILIETKAHGGTVTVEHGRLLINDRLPEKDFIAQTLRNAVWLRQRIQETTQLDVWIQPIIVFTNAFVKEWEPIRNVRLRNIKYLLSAVEETRANRSVAAALWDLHRQGRRLF